MRFYEGELVLVGNKIWKVDLGTPILFNISGTGVHLISPDGNAEAWAVLRDVKRVCDLTDVEKAIYCSNLDESPTTSKDPHRK